MEKLESTVGYKFSNKKLLIEALTHPSKQDSEFAFGYDRLEFLGDSVLNFIVAEMLFRLYQDGAGKLSKLRAFMVCRKTINEVASSLNLGDFIIMSKGEEASHGRNNQGNIENCMEALLGAIYLDGGIDVVRRIIEGLWVKCVDIDEVAMDPKSYLQELAQSHGLDAPLYMPTRTSGSAHAPLFEVVVLVGEMQVPGIGSSKKEAEKVAARAAIDLWAQKKA